MARKTVVVLEADNAISLGKINKKTGKTTTKAEGFYLGFKTTPSKLNPGVLDQLHIFKTEKGTLGVWGFTSLNTQLASIPKIPGKATYAYVDYKGKITLPSGKTKHTVQVDFDDENHDDVGDVSLKTETSEEPQGLIEEDTNTYANYDEVESEDSNDSYEEPVVNTPPAAARPRTSGLTPEQQAKSRALIEKAKAAGAAKRTA